MNKFKFYLHLRSLNITEEIAIAMTKQTAKEARKKYEDAWDATLSFCDWCDTAEGHDYWSEINEEYNICAQDDF